MTKGYLEINDRSLIHDAKDIESKPFYISVSWENKQTMTGGGCCVQTLEEVMNFFKSSVFENCIIELCDRPIKLTEGTWQLKRYSHAEAQKAKMLFNIQLN